MARIIAIAASCLALTTAIIGTTPVVGQNPKWLRHQAVATGGSESDACARARAQAVAQARTALALNTGRCRCAPFVSGQNNAAATYRCVLDYELLMRTGK